MLLNAFESAGQNILDAFEGFGRFMRSCFAELLNAAAL